MLNKQVRGNKQEMHEATERVLEWFFSYPRKEMSLNDIVEECSISKTTANIVIHALIDEGFLRKEELGRTWRITANNEHVYAVSRKLPWNLRHIYESDLRTLVLEQFPQAKNIILFGSYRDGSDTELSDIDIAVERVDDFPPEIIPFGFFNQIGRRKNVPINITLFSRNNVSINLFNNIAHGIVLWGFLEVRP